MITVTCLALSQKYIIFVFCLLNVYVLGTTYWTIEGRYSK